MNNLELDQLLKLSESSAPPHAGFQRDVWLRIQAAEAMAWKPRMGVLVGRLIDWFAFPPVAVATCSAMVAAGVWIGLIPGNSKLPGEVAYVQSISPFAQTYR